MMAVDSKWSPLTVSFSRGNRMNTMPEPSLDHREAWRPLRCSSKIVHDEGAVPLLCFHLPLISIGGDEHPLQSFKPFEVNVIYS